MSALIGTVLNRPANGSIAGSGPGSGIPTYAASPAFGMPSQVPTPPPAAPAQLVAQWKTQVIDVSQMSSWAFQLDYQRITGQASGFLMGNIATPASFQVEASEDGNTFVALTATTAPGITNTQTITANIDGVLQQAPYNKPAFKYVQARLVLVGGAQVFAGAALAAPATLLQNSTCHAFSPDGLVLFIGSSTTPYLTSCVVTPATMAFAAVANIGVALVGTTPVALDVIGPFSVQGVATYYVLMALTLTPFWGIVSWTAAGGFGPVISSVGATNTPLAGAGLSCKWARNVPLGQNQVAFIGATGAPGLYGFNFSTVSGTVTSACNLTTSQSGAAMPVPGANVGAIDISLDGSFMITGESSTPFTHMFTLNVSASPTQPFTGYAANPNTLPSAAIIAVAIHPSGEAAMLVIGATMAAYNILRNPGSFNAPPYTSSTFNPQGFVWGWQQLTTVTLGPAFCCCYHPNGSAFYVGTTTGTPFMKGYPVGDYKTGHLGTAETAPVAITNMTAAKGISFHPWGQAIVISGTSSAAAGSAGAVAWLMDANIGISLFGSNYN